MTNITLQSLNLKNFKGIEDFSLILDGKNADIYGKNATGKSSIYNAFLFLLFGKDSFNRSDFNIKPQDEDGNERHHLESIVEGILLVGGKPLRLKRALMEKWTKVRGVEEKVFKGNETSYWVDDVPVKASEYALEINMIIKENIFKLLTNPLFFNTDGKGFGWQERRKILFEISGDLSDSDVIDSLVTIGDKSMLDLQMVINSGRTIDNHKLVVAEKIKNSKSSMEGIPSRIDEQKRTIPTDVVDYTAIENTLTGHKTTLEGIESELATNANGANLYRQKQQQAFRLNDKIVARKKELDDYSMAGLKMAIDEKSKLDGDKYRISLEVKGLGGKSESRLAELDAIAKSIIELRDTWKEENVKQFVSPEGFNCPTCEQALPEGKTQEKIDKLKANFDKNKAQVLASISKKGIDATERCEVINGEKVADDVVLSTLEASLNKTNERLAELEREIEVEQKQHGSFTDYELDEKYTTLTAELESLNTELNKPIEDTSSEVLARRKETTELIEELNRTLNQKEVVEKAKVRIDELKAEESKLAGELSEYERQDSLIKQFTSAKVKMLEDSINNRFETVKFKLFDVLNDGTEKEVCKTLVNTNGVWVEFDGANNGGKINAGLSIIQMLSEFYGVTCPIFVDNAESVTGFVEIKSQVIKLVVSEKDSVLRVEVNG